ncbi:MAG: nucleotide sugar dehydrogenase [Patescibacteria group bacterium]
MAIKNICIIGMGFIGTTLAAVLAEAGFEVFGIERDAKKLEQLKQGKSHFFEKGLEEILATTTGKNLNFFEKIPADKKIDAFIITVFTPVDETTKKPDLTHVKNAIGDLLPHLQDGQLIVLRSTVPVGVSRNMVFPILEKSGKKIHLSFCPERIAEGKAIEELKTLPQIIGGLDEESIKLSEEIFSKITPSVVKTSSPETAEIIKLINNSYRDFSFAYANQIALICKNLNLDAKEVIESANKDYPRSNILQPGFVGGNKPGFVGGVCLEKDPYILLDLIDQSGIDGGLIKAARLINESLANHVFEKSAEHLKEKKDAKILISGFAFKGHPETDDMRGSPAVKLLEIFKKARFSNIYGHDFIVKKTDIENLGVRHASLEEGMQDADTVIFMNNHKKYQDIDIENLAGKAKPGALIFDGWQLFDQKIKNIKNINYESIGYRKPATAA